MSDVLSTAPGSLAFDGHTPSRPRLDSGFNARTAVAFFSVLGLALFFIAYSVYGDVADSGARTTSVLPYLLLGVALFIALGFEFVNGFHDTANAVATVIYTHSLPAHVAVVWSGSRHVCAGVKAPGMARLSRSRPRTRQSFDRSRSDRNRPR